MPKYYGKRKTTHRDDDAFNVSDIELRQMARALDVDERRRGNAKYRRGHKMRISEFCRLMEEADLRKRSKHVGVWREKRSRRLNVGQFTKRGQLRSRERRYRSSRETRKQQEAERRSGTRFDGKVRKRLLADHRREQRRLYRESLRRGEELTPHQVAVLLDDDISDSEEEMEFVEPKGFY